MLVKYKLADIFDIVMTGASLKTMLVKYKSLEMDLMQIKT